MGVDLEATRPAPEGPALIPVLQELTGVLRELTKAARQKRRDWPEYPAAGWGGDSIAETEVSCRTGYRCNGGGSAVEVRFDVCPKCFMEKLVPWFAAQGAKPTKEHTDW